MRYHVHIVGTQRGEFYEADDTFTSKAGFAQFATDIVAMIQMEQILVTRLEINVA